MPRSRYHKHSAILAPSEYNSKVIIDGGKCGRALLATQLFSQHLRLDDVVRTETFLQFHSLEVERANILFENNALEGSFQKEVFFGVSLVNDGENLSFGKMKVNSSYSGIYMLAYLGLTELHL